jgi:hypothetical protein
VLPLPHFRTLYFLRDGKGRRICVIEKFWRSFFLFVFNDLQNLSRNTVMQLQKCRFTGNFQ